MNMNQEELSFYGAALTGGAILSGFVATFFSFRIQREASYYSQPVFDSTEQKWKAPPIGLSHFPASLALIILSWFVSTIFGVVCPLCALAHRRPSPRPALVLAGIVCAVVLVGAYFFAEMLHYEMFRSKPGVFDCKEQKWKPAPQWGVVRCLLPLGEWGLVMCFLLLAILFGVVTYYCVVKGDGDVTGLVVEPPPAPAGLSDVGPCEVPPKELAANPGVAVLRSGISIRFERKQVVGTTTRFYVGDGACDWLINIPTNEIDHLEGDPNSKKKM
jgi:hypothetical protein